MPPTGAAWFFAKGKKGPSGFPCRWRRQVGNRPRMALLHRSGEGLGGLLTTFSDSPRRQEAASSIAVEPFLISREANGDYFRVLT
jgi:hypothetical protein